MGQYISGYYVSSFSGYDIDKAVKFATKEVAEYYDSNKIYRKNDIIYFGVDHDLEIYNCIVDETTGVFDANAWKKCKFFSNDEWEVYDSNFDYITYGPSVLSIEKDNKFINIDVDTIVVEIVETEEEPNLTVLMNLPILDEAKIGEYLSVEEKYRTFIKDILNTLDAFLDTIYSLRFSYLYNEYPKVRMQIWKDFYFLGEPKHITKYVNELCLKIIELVAQEITTGTITIDGAGNIGYIPL